jgi:hypothetical protein
MKPYKSVFKEDDEDIDPTDIGADFINDMYSREVTSAQKSLENAVKKKFNDLMKDYKKDYKNDFNDIMSFVNDMSTQAVGEGDADTVMMLISDLAKKF